MEMWYMTVALAVVLFIMLAVWVKQIRKVRQAERQRLARRAASKAERSEGEQK